jgi:hypothetical protein
LAVFQTRPGVSHRLVAVLVAVPEPPVPVLVPVAVVDAAPVSVADSVAVAVFDLVAVAVAERASGAVSNALSVAVINAVSVPELEMLTSWAESGATAGK